MENILILIMFLYSFHSFFQRQKPQNCEIKFVLLYTFIDALLKMQANPKENLRMRSTTKEKYK